MKTNLIISLLIFAGLSFFAGFQVLNNSEIANDIAESRQQCDVKVADLLEEFYSKSSDFNREAEPPKKVKVTSRVKKSSSHLTTDPKDIDLTEREVKPGLQKFNETLAEIVKRKYRFMLSSLNLTEEEKLELLRLLMERERIALKINDIKQYGDELAMDQGDLADLNYELERIDEEINDILLSESNREKFVLLKESDQEQKEFGQYTLGVDGLFPLSREQQETVLLTRLKHKQEFERFLNQSGFYMDFPLSNGQKDELMQGIESAAENYKVAFLSDVKPHLAHDNFPMDQYTLLENYTNTEFGELIVSLREKIDERGAY